MIGSAPAKINLALVVGPCPPGRARHELVTVYQRVDLTDEIDIEPGGETTVTGFAEDTIVRRALDGLGAPHGWRVHIDKHIPVAAGLGGGSSDAATALRLANAQLGEPLPPARLHELAAEIGADVPFFLADGPQLGSGDGTVLTPIALPREFAVLLLLPHGATKPSTRDVYRAFDDRGGESGYAERAARLRAALSDIREPRDLARLPANDLASSPLAQELFAAGAFRADVSGAGPTLYGLFDTRADALRAERLLRDRGRTWVASPK